jgi:hypothetical protein
MSLLILESVGPRGEELAMKAGEVTDTPVGFDPELETATFDSDDLPEGELQAIVFDALAGVRPRVASAPPRRGLGPAA